MIAPETNNAFTSAKRTYMSEYGKVGAEWSMEEGKFKLKVEIPCNTTATVKLPDGDCMRWGAEYISLNKSIKGNKMTVFVRTDRQKQTVSFS